MTAMQPAVLSLVWPNKEISA